MFLSISTFQRLFVIWNIASSGVFWGIYFAWNRVLRSEVIIRKRDSPLCQETCPSNYLGRWNHCFCHELHSCNICYGKFFILERQVEKNCLIGFRFWRKEQIVLCFTWLLQICIAKTLSLVIRFFELHNRKFTQLKGAFSWWKIQIDALFVWNNQTFQIKEIINKLVIFHKGICFSRSLPFDASLNAITSPEL